MSIGLPEGVTGLHAQQQMLDVSGDNPANVNTTAFNSSGATFSELLSETIKKTSQSGITVGGSNPYQVGSGFGTFGISANIAQGNIVNTGSPFDLAMEGDGYFVLSNGSQNVYTRSGAFAVDGNSNLIDPPTGYIVQRIGSVGEAEGFQAAGNSNIRVPYDVAMPAHATSSVTVAGNLSSDATVSTSLANVLKSDVTYTTSNGTAAMVSTDLVDLDQFSGTLGAASTITATGRDSHGNALVDTGLPVTASTDLNALISHLNTKVLTASEQVASLSNGRILITDSATGYSQSDLKLTFADNGSAALTMPGYFEVSTVGGEEVKNININVYDSHGDTHVLSGAFVRTENNTWDMVLTSITGDISGLSDRRIRGIAFNAEDGSYSGLKTTIGDTAQFEVTFAHDTSSPQTITMDFGTSGQFNGLTQFPGSSTAVAREQDGYMAGSLSSVSVNKEGILVGAFSNGIKKDIAAVQIALFQNTSGLESLGNSYFNSSANSGEALATQAMTGGGGKIHGGSLEKSKADVASEFVNVLQAQDGFKSNARTIRFANEILSELTSLIR